MLDAVVVDSRVRCRLLGCGGVFFDRTCLRRAFGRQACLKATLYFPTDWVLLRTAAHTLMKATVLIRREGLKQRMPREPRRFLSEMNKLGMAMSAGRGTDSKQKRIGVFM